jgi:hypothetical protein
MAGVPHPEGEESAASALALLAGLAFWGADALAARLRGRSERSAPAAQPPVPLPAEPPRRLLPAGRIRARGLAVGVAIALSQMTCRAVARAQVAAGPASRVLVRLSSPFARLPAVRRAIEGSGSLLARAETALGEVAAAGEREAARCQRLAEGMARELAAEVLAAVAQASGVREVLIEQSSGLAVEALAEVRSRARQADDRIADAARSILPWRRRRGRGGGPAKVEGLTPPALGLAEPRRP